MDGVVDFMSLENIPDLLTHSSLETVDCPILPSLRNETLLRGKHRRFQAILCALINALMSYLKLIDKL